MTNDFQWMKTFVYNPNHATLGGSGHALEYCNFFLTDDGALIIVADSALDDFMSNITDDDVVTRLENFGRLIYEV